jgi:DNA-binding response OmpR family regulator
MASSIAEVGPLRVLVVEPDARTRSLLEVGLSRAGFAVVTARTLAEAHEHLGLGRALPAMLVCETDLAGEDGFRFCGQLRADLRTAQIPVVMLSQRPEAFHLEMASGAGADDYLPKPVFLNDVVALAKLKAGESAAQAVFAADTSTLPIGELLRALLAGMRSGQIELQDGTARLTFRQGQAIDAEVEGVRGARALSRMLLLSRGAYRVTFGPALARGSLSVDLRELCRSVLPDLARSRRAQERALPLEAVLQPDTARLREVLPDLPEGVNSLVRLFNGERTLKQVLLRCELPEASALLITTRLYGLGALGPEGPGKPAAPGSLEEALAAISERAREVAQAKAQVQALAPVVAIASAAPATLGPAALTPVPPPAIPVSLALVPAPPAPAPALLALVPAPPAFVAAPLSLAPAPALVPAMPEPPRSLHRAPVQDDFGQRLDKALQLSAAAARKRALTPPPAPIVSVHYFEAKRPLARDTQPMRIPTDLQRARAWWRSAQAKVAAGALVLFFGSAGLGSVLFRPAAPAEGTAPPAASAARFSVLPEWLAPRADGTAEGWTALGRRRYDEGDLEGAKAAAVQALAVDAQSGPALLLLATIHYGMNHPVEAKVALRRYLAVDPGGQFAAEARTLLQR